MIVFTEKEALEVGAKYHKECHICGKEYWATSRNNKYCCEECAEKALTKITKRNKTRRVRRKAYDANKEVNRVLSKSYGLAHDVARLYKIPEVCSCDKYGYKDKCSGAIELHHDDGNPFNEAPWNLVFLCRHHHSMADDEHAKVNMVDTYNEAIDEAGFEEEENKHNVMIQYTKDKIEGNLNDGD